MARIPSHRIRVTKEIIINSQPNSQRHCMEADAVRIAIPGAWSVQVTSESIRFNVGGNHIEGESTRYNYPNPARAGFRAQELDRLHDEGYSMEEIADKIGGFTFNLDGRQATSAPVVRTGERGTYRKRKTHKKKSRIERVCTTRRHSGLADVPKREKENG